ncbi:cryptochrome/photolyase family protein [Aeromicrobium sp. 179-A 4D2 NHS]|uniref:cryptochrome/photolyase family protein n=1 Tax=Aeromicrobium sp. 179-A 4D2 NHS TaxID=3142375 RepID=UPI0039A16BC4
MTSIWWIRRDLRLADNPALVAAAAQGEVVPLIVRDPRLAGTGRPRRARLEASLVALDEAMNGALVVRTGDPADVVPEVADEAGATSVHVTGEYTPFGRRRDERVVERLEEAGIEAVATGTPYAVEPGTVLSGQGTPYKVFTPFSKAWREIAYVDPAPRPEVEWVRLHGEDLDHELAGFGRGSGPVGEAEALRHWREFVDERLADYGDQRNRPDLDTTSRMSVHLKLGEIHPRTMLADLHDLAPDDEGGVERYVTELAWREFYADVLWHRPDSAWSDLRDELRAMPYDSGPDTAALVDAWREGRTGFPFVDAGMRQLLEQGWMHNRLRMVTASFLVKDLHVWWPVGAQHFLDHLIDGDIASNNHGWQWVAGTGTDAAPYFRVFNPVGQGRRFDPDGAYVRRWVPELAHLDGAAAHEPWKVLDGYAHGYPEPIVDHAEERRAALDRYDRARGR